MDLTWTTIIEKPDKKFDLQTLRTKEMSYEQGLEEILNSLEKLGYEIFLYRDCSISLLRYVPKADKDMHALTIVGTPEEILAIQLDPRFRKFMSKPW